MGMIDIESRAVGENHIGRADLVGVDHRRWTAEAPQVESAGVAQRRLDLVVPTSALGPRHTGGSGVCQHRLRGREDRIGRRFGRGRYSVLDLDTDDALHTASLSDRKDAVRTEDRAARSKYHYAALRTGPVWRVRGGGCAALRSLSREQSVLEVLRARGTPC